MGFPTQRPRRTRQSEPWRRLVRETRLSPAGFIYPMFLVPGRGETLRVNGRASIIRDAEVLARLAVEGKTPRLAIGVEVEEIFLHCAKAFKRSSLWRPEAWPDIGGLASAACMLMAHARPDGMTLEQMEQRLRHSYTTQLY